MKPYGHNATLMMLFVGTGLSVTQSQRVFKIKKYASVILFPNDLYFLLIIQEK